MQTSKCFISQPMKNKTIEQIKNEREEVIEFLHRNGMKEISSIFENNEEPVYALGESIKLMANADCAYFMKGWNEARGCIIEHEVCERYGIPIVTDQLWIKKSIKTDNDELKVFNYIVDEDDILELYNIASRYADNSLKYKYI